MKAIKFLIWTLEPIQDDYVGLDDIVSVNGLTGWLDFYCESYLVIITESEVHHKIFIKDIRSFYKLSTFMKSNMTNIPIKELLAA